MMMMMMMMCVGVCVGAWGWERSGGDEKNIRLGYEGKMSNSQMREDQREREREREKQGLGR